MVRKEFTVGKPPICDSPYFKRGVGGVVALLAITTIAVGALALKLEFANVGETPGIIMMSTGGGVLILDLYLSYRKWYPSLIYPIQFSFIEDCLTVREYIVFRSYDPELKIAYVGRNEQGATGLYIANYYDPVGGIQYVKSRIRYDEPSRLPSSRYELAQDPVEISFYEFQKRYAGSTIQYLETA